MRIAVIIGYELTDIKQNRLFCQNITDKILYPYRTCKLVEPKVSEYYFNENKKEAILI